MRLIDADEVIRDLASLKYSKEYGKVGGTYNLAIDDCIEEIEATPALDAKPIVYAHWIEGNEDHVSCDSICYYTCSECNHSFSDDTPYCPNCGAKMDEEVERWKK